MASPGSLAGALRFELRRARRTGFLVRLWAFVAGPSLDAELAHGVSPTASILLGARADWITSPPSNTSLPARLVVSTILWFYGVAVLVLIIQHVAVSVSSLSILQDRQRGAVDLFRVSPIRATELLVGKYLAFATLSMLVGAIVLGLLVVGFGVPVLGTPEHLFIALGLLVLAATGVGLLVSLVSDSDRQAVQLALIILLASVFFSGLAIDRSHLSPLVQTLTEVLPTTQATNVMQDLLLRGVVREPARVAVLACMAAGLFVLGLTWLRRELSPRSS